VGDETADGVRVDSLDEWQAAAEEVRRLERVAQGKRETLLSAARADALAQGELGAGRRLLAGLERSLIAGTALAGPSPVRAGLNATRREISGASRDEISGAYAARRVPVEDWQADELKPRGPVVGITTDIFTVTPASDAPLQPGADWTIDRDKDDLAKHGRTQLEASVTGAPMPDAPSTDYYAGVADKRRAPKPETSPADYWSGAARNPRRRWQVWRKK
jgi:hypothetical protein